MLIYRNKKLDTEEKAALDGAIQARVEEVAHLEGMSFEQALEKRKGFRYLY
jgi:RNA polymerase-interacting CarD/CdnL/TRCF family regulator